MRFGSGEDFGNPEPLPAKLWAWSASQPLPMTCHLLLLGKDQMRTFDAEPQVLQDLREESEIVTAQAHQDFNVWAVRHPTLGKLVIIEGRDGSGVIVETEE